jgi:hypothetical protein
MCEVSGEIDGKNTSPKYMETICLSKELTNQGTRKYLQIDINQSSIWSPKKFILDP